MKTFKQDILEKFIKNDTYYLIWYYLKPENIDEIFNKKANNESPFSSLNKK